jgi:hypothetical protein
MKDVDGRTALTCAVEGGSVAIIRHLLAKEVKMDYKYKIVSEHHPHLNESTRLMADTVILENCSV